MQREQIHPLKSRSVIHPSIKEKNHNKFLSLFKDQTERTKKESKRKTTQDNNPMRLL